MHARCARAHTHSHSLALTLSSTHSLTDSRVHLRAHLSDACSPKHKKKKHSNGDDLGHNQHQNAALSRLQHLQPHRGGPLGSPQDDIVEEGSVSSAERPQYEGLVVIGGDDSPT